MFAFQESQRRTQLRRPVPHSEQPEHESTNLHVQLIHTVHKLYSASSTAHDEQ